MLVVEEGRMPRRTLVQLHADSFFESEERIKRLHAELLDLYRAAVQAASAERRSRRNPS